MEAIPPALRLAFAAASYLAAYATGVALFAWAARRRGLAARDLRIVAAAALIGGLAGAEIAQLAAAATPGKSILGGIAGGWLAVIFAKRSLGMVRPLGDLFAFAIAGGEAVGRFGCFFAGCCYGKIAHLPWAVWDHGAPRHPTQLYASAAAFATFATIVALDRRARLPDNAIFYLQGAMFCALRFVVELFRDVPSYGGFTLAQYACVVGFAFFAIRLRGLLGPRPAAIA
ncbi:MAG: prolipoprotein diacylglyceryl transferase [Candidatus Eremiobacteraeota bacterium]|nr:prolipoprotein diacylglyceryl transferase [Candidatus Eremiobacteraeota bacterium]